ncbi:MAG: hypothetical protein OXE05_05465 [Chloroflexi bacterium]|nr:hypothetical protein [Chloroflexota bacterium]
MFDIGLPELMIILLLGLVLLGPDRLPGVIRQFSGVVRMLRSSYSEALATFKDQLGDVQEDIDAIRGEISSIQGEVRSTAEDVEKDVKEVESEVKTASADIKRDLDETAKEAAATRPDQVGAEAAAPPVVASVASSRPAISERGAAWTPQGTQTGGGSPLQQDLFAGLMRSLKARLGEDWLVEQAAIYRDLGTRAAERNAEKEQDVAALVRTWADMHRNSLPEGSLQIIETGRDYRVRMRQCPFSFTETDDVELCRSCGAYDLAYLEERTAEAKWESHLTAGDPWCELVFAKPPPPPKPEPAEEAPAEEPTATVNGDAVVATEDSTQTVEPQAAAASAVDPVAAGSEFSALAQAFRTTAEDADSPEPAATDVPDVAAVDEAKLAVQNDDSAQASAVDPVVAETSADADADSPTKTAGRTDSGKKEAAP